MKTKLLIAILLVSGTAHAQLWQDENGRQNPLFAVPSQVVPIVPRYGSQTITITEQRRQQDNLSVANVLGSDYSQGRTNVPPPRAPIWDVPNTHTYTIQTSPGGK